MKNTKKQDIFLAEEERKNRINRAAEVGRGRDKRLFYKRFIEEDYICEMYIYNDNDSLTKFALRGMFGYIEVRRVDQTETIKLGYSTSMDLNDWDLSPRYIEHGLLGQLEMFIRQQKEKTT